LDEAVEHLPAWIPCPSCEEWMCTIHMTHASECPCPSVDEWSVDPYAEPPPGQRLSPSFAEWLMGFPTGWTDLEP
jgi:hypothetical protein